MLNRHETQTAVSPQEYRDAMARFAGAVSVLTTAGPAGNRGLTASAVVSVSDNPPTLLACLNRNREENLHFQVNGCMAVNVLCADQIDLARAFAGERHLSMEERFALAEWRDGETGAPILNNARVTLDCMVRDVQSVHTHYIVMAEVRATYGSRGDDALIYLDRQYRSL